MNEAFAVWDGTLGMLLAVHGRFGTTVFKGQAAQEEQNSCGSLKSR
jgi:hypothetical protein